MIRSPDKAKLNVARPCRAAYPQVHHRSPSSRRLCSSDWLRRVSEGREMEKVTVTLDLPVDAPLSSTVRALEAARDAQTDPRVKQALAMATALASRGLVKTLAKSLEAPGDK